jgi:hypothetical protein
MQIAVSGEDGALDRGAQLRVLLKIAHAEFWQPPALHPAFRRLIVDATSGSRATHGIRGSTASN